MLHKLASVWEGLRTSLWFLPSLIVGGAVSLALGMIELDGFGGREHLTERWPRLFGAGAEGSRGLLAAIAGSMITVAGVTFSITVVALALASSQYTSRILANFMRDRANQAVLGVFVGVFAYSLVVLRTIRGGNDGLFVPALAVLVALVLALMAIGFLIFFIHHIAASIQANSIQEQQEHSEQLSSKRRAIQVCCESQQSLDVGFAEDVWKELGLSRLRRPTSRRHEFCPVPTAPEEAKLPNDSALIGDADRLTAGVAPQPGANQMLERVIARAVRVLRDEALEGTKQLLATLVRGTQGPLEHQEGSDVGP